MNNIHKLAAVSLMTAMFTAAGCTSSTTDKSTDTESQHTTDTAAMVHETESIAGLPAQKDSVITKKQYTDYKFADVGQAVAFMQQSPNWAKYQEGILPQMASENLKYATKLLNSPYNHFIVVDKDKMKVILFDRYGRIVHQYGMAGPRNFGTKHKKGDSRTPEGYFSAEGVYNSTDWEFTDDNGVRHPGKCFGPRFIRVKNPVTTQVGIHGTSSPGSIGRRTSHGCIRLHNENIMQLVKYVEIGMPIIILPGPEDRKVNAREGSPTGYFNTGVERYSRAQMAPANVAKPSTQSADSVASQPAEEPKQQVEEPASPQEQPQEPVTPDEVPEE